MAGDGQGDAVIWLSLAEVWYTQLAIFDWLDAFVPGFWSKLLTDLSKWTWDKGLLQRTHLGLTSLLERAAGCGKVTQWLIILCTEVLF